jgi:NAD(P)-dependent dehydrogenase (short-subunit alcohol dehydrogenase family)
MFDLGGKVVVITGGCGLLGREFVRAVTVNNGVAIVADIDEAKAQIYCEELKRENTQFKVGACALDITKKGSVSALIEFCIKTFGRVDAVVNNAYPRNLNYGRGFFDVEYDDFCDNVSMHLGGYFLVSQQFAGYFIDNGGGRIINIASIYGVVPPRFEIYAGTSMENPVEYAAIKSGVIHLTKYMANYFKGKNIQVNSISPGGLLAGQPDGFLEKYKGFCTSKGMLDPVDIQGALLFLLSDLSTFVNGQNLVVDDGFSL